MLPSLTNWTDDLRHNSCGTWTRQINKGLVCLGQKLGQKNSFVDAIAAS